MELRIATARLESDPEVTVIEVHAGRAYYRGEGANQESLRLHRFVSAIERHERINRIHLFGFRFTGSTRIDDDDDDDDDLQHEIRGHERGRDQLPAPVGSAADRLFGAVLPGHPTLTDLGIERCTVGPRHLQSLLSALLLRPPDRIFCLGLNGCQLDRESLRHVAAALQRNLRVRTIFVADDKMDSDLVRSICDAAAGNPNVRKLVIIRALSWNDPMSAADAFGQVLGVASSVRQLRIVNFGWTATFIPDLAHMLRTNAVLGTLECFSIHDVAHLELLLDLLRTYNFTLDVLVLGSLPGEVAEYQARIDRVLARNRQIVRAYHRLRGQVPRIGNGPPLWPEAIARISPFPTLFYRFLKGGGGGGGAAIAAAAASATLAHESQQSRRRRGVPPNDGE
jgi:hypothetical protein